MKTVILCGGRGTRLGEAGERLPKTLLPLNGKPCLQYIVDSYVRKGYRDFVLCIGYRGDMIVEFCRSQLTGASFELSDSGENASMLARLHDARRLIGDRAWIAYGDTLIDVDLAHMLAEHESSGAALTLTTAEVRSPFGLVDVDAARWLKSFDEKPVHSYFVGHMLMERSVLERDVDAGLLAAPDGAGLVTLIQRLAAQRRVRTHTYSGPQITFNTPHDLDRAQREVIEFFTQSEGTSA